MKKLFVIFSILLISVGLTGCLGHQSDSATVNGYRLADLKYDPGHSAIVKVNRNRSTLNPNDWRSDHVQYSNLDRLNRASEGNTADLAKPNVANDSLRQRQYVYPSGWHQKFVGQMPILNRGHLIAYSLSKGIDISGRYQPQNQSGDQNNPKNLFTQTAFSNQKLQTIYESKVRAALRKGKKVIFQARPIFKDHDLMARGIHLQAISTDRSLNFNVYLFNVQPGVKFDYSTGRSQVDNQIRVPTPKGAPDFNRIDRRKLSRDVEYHLLRETHHRYHYRYRPARTGSLRRKRLIVE